MGDLIPANLKKQCLEWYRRMMETWVVDKTMPRPDTQAKKLMDAIGEAFPDEVDLICSDVKACIDHNFDPLTGNDLSRWREDPRGSMRHG